MNFKVPTNIYFGIDMINELGNIVKPLGNNCLLITTENVAPLATLYTKIKELLNTCGITTYHYDKVVPNPTTDIIEEGIHHLQANNIDFVLSVGGGSSIDTAKSICLLNELDTFEWDVIFNKFNNPHENYQPICNKYIPHVSIPTTAGTGSEVTQASVISFGKDKNTIFHPLNYCDFAILDPTLLLTLPKKLTASTGFDAFCHAFESYINPNASVFSELTSIQSIKTIKDYLVKSVHDLANISYRKQLLYAQTLAGISLSNAGASAPHPLSEILGGITHISHGESLALIFPEFLDQFYPKNITKFANISRIFDNTLMDESDEFAASKLSSIIESFLKEIDLYHTFEFYSVSSEDFDEIYNCPILNYLPFGDKEELQSIYQKSYNRGK